MTRESDPTSLERTVLPPPDPTFNGRIEVAFKDSEADYPEPLKAPAGAPNVLLVMGDDIGYGHMSAFGGPANTPTFDRLAAAGLIFSNFHTTPVCAASRACLLTGRNAHTVAMGGVPEDLDGLPGLQQQHPAQRGHGARHLAPERLRHGVDRQDPPHPDPRDHPRRPVRSVAAGDGDRVLLRLLRPGREPVAPAVVGEHDAVAGPSDAGGGLPPGSRHGRQDDRLDPAPEVDPSRQAVGRLLRAELSQAARRGAA